MSDDITVLTFDKPAAFCGATFVADLADAGITVAESGVYDNADGTIGVVTDADENAVQAVLAAHTGEPPPAPPTLDELVAAAVAEILGNA